MDIRIFKKHIPLILTVLMAGVLAWVISSPLFLGDPEIVSQSPVQEEPEQEKKNEINQEVEPPVVIKQKVLHEVPFTAQAPFANWDDQRYQNACEEASVLMAWHWVSGDMTLTREEANQIIADIVEYENQNYGVFINTSAKDTVRFANTYFQTSAFQLSTSTVSIESIKKELSRGSLVIVPADGQRLNNLNYTPPGPERHMLVIIGYDDARKVFITNDPGTRNGEKFEFSYENLLNSIRDYPSGDHAPITGISKVMITVKK